VRQRRVATSEGSQGAVTRAWAPASANASRTVAQDEAPSSSFGSLTAPSRTSGAGRVQSTVVDRPTPDAHPLELGGRFTRFADAGRGAPRRPVIDPKQAPALRPMATATRPKAVVSTPFCSSRGGSRAPNSCPNGPAHRATADRTCPLRLAISRRGSPSPLVHLLKCPRAPSVER